MALPTSGEISYNDINIELGASSGSLADMNTMTATATGDTGITNQPDAINEWYGYSHISYGDCHGLETHNSAIYLKRMDHGGTYLLNSTTTLEFAADRNENTRCEKSGGVTLAFGDQAGGAIRYRAKNTNDSWVIAQSWKFAYYSEQYSCVFSTYDYQWTVTQQ